MNKKIWGLNPITSKKTDFYDNFVSFWTRHSKHIVSTWTHHSEHSCHIEHFLSFWTVLQRTIFSTSIWLVGYDKN